MAINENWNIRSRSHVCAHTGRAFEDGEAFITMLAEDAATGELLRKDFSLDAWEEVQPALKGQVFSFWRTEYQVVKAEARPEITEKESAESLLRRLIAEDSITTENTRYILAVMLERKKLLKQTGTQETEDAVFLVYEHQKNGEVYLIRDPELKLAQIEEVQKEVSRLLGGGQPEESGNAAGTGTGSGQEAGDREGTSPEKVEGKGAPAGGDGVEAA